MSKKDEGERQENPMTITGNRPPADRSPNSTSEGKRQQAAKLQQEQAQKNAPKVSKKKIAPNEDTLRYYQGSEYQKNIEEQNTKISESTDADERRKMSANLRKEAYPEKKGGDEEEEEKPEKETKQERSDRLAENKTFGGFKR
jgi:hypothetical protein